MLLLAIGLSVPLNRTFAQDTVTAPEFLNPQTLQAIEEGLDWLASRQHRNGSFDASDEYTENVGVTSLCGMAFLCSGSVPGQGKYSQTVSRTLDFVLQCSKSNGFIIDSNSASHGPMYGHGFGTMFLAELYGMSRREDLREKLHRAVDLIIATQNPEGGWRYYPVPNDADISVTVCQMMALRAARNAGIAVPKQVIDNAVDYVKKCQTIDGGFRYRLFDAAEAKLARSSAALVALYTAGVANDPTVEQGLTFLDQKLKVRDDRDYYYYAQYYSAQAIWHAGGDHWKTGFPILRDDLFNNLVDGHWEDRLIGDEYATAMSLIVLQIPLDRVPIFER